MNLIAIGFDVQLINFHVWLTKKGITTFQHVTYLRELKENQASLKNGLMTLFEFEDWKANALQSNDPLKKSKTIVKKQVVAVSNHEEESIQTPHVSQDNISQNADFDNNASALSILGPSQVYHDRSGSALADRSSNTIIMQADETELADLKNKEGQTAPVRTILTMKKPEASKKTCCASVTCRPCIQPKKSIIPTAAPPAPMTLTPSPSPLPADPAEHKKLKKEEKSEIQIIKKALLVKKDHSQSSTAVIE